MTARPIRYQRQVSDRKGKIFYTSITSLSHISKVIVHETVKDEDGERSREIEVYLNFIGKFDVPMQLVELSPEEQKRQEALKKRRIHQRNKRVQKRQERMNAQLKNESPI